MNRHSESEAPPPVHRGPPPLLLLFGLAVLFAGWFGWWIGKPLGSWEVQPSFYYGPAARYFDEHGFVALGGVPVMGNAADDPVRGVAYLHHPPASFWLGHLCGSAEWQLRFASHLCLFFAALFLFQLLRPSIGRVGGALAALCLVLPPMHSYHTVGSPGEPMTLAVGLLFLWSFRRWIQAPDPGSRQRARWICLGAAVLGPWTYWAFAIFCLAVIPLAWPGGPLVPALGTAIRRLLLPGLSALLAAAAVLAWQAWMHGAGPAMPSQSNLFGNLFGSAVLERPDPGELIAAVWARLQECFTLPLLVAAALGLPLLWRRDRLLACSLGIAGVLYQVIFSKHSLDHQLYQMMTSPLVAACAAVLFCTLAGGAAARRPGPRVLLATAAAAAVIGQAAWTSLSYLDRDGWEFHRDLGSALSEATTDADREYYVLCSSLMSPYYLLERGIFLAPLTDPALLQLFAAPESERTAAARQLFATLEDPSTPIGDRGLRYLWLRSDRDDDPANGEALAAFLADFPKVRLPQLEQSFDYPFDGPRFHYPEAWLVTLREPGSPGGR